jgi:hypothetical protein
MAAVAAAVPSHHTHNDGSSRNEPARSGSVNITSGGVTIKPHRWIITMTASPPMISSSPLLLSNGLTMMNGSDVERMATKVNIFKTIVAVIIVVCVCLIVNDVGSTSRQ